MVARDSGKPDGAGEARKNLERHAQQMNFLQAATVFTVLALMLALTRAAINRKGFGGRCSKLMFRGSAFFLP